LAAVSQNFEQQAGSGTYDVSAGKLWARCRPTWLMHLQRLVWLRPAGKPCVSFLSSFDQVLQKKKSPS
jgi:hypothetical protein